MRVVDGLQRLSTVRDFVRGKESFPLKELKYLKDCEGKVFANLPQPLRRRIHNTQIMAHVIDPATPPSVKYDIFKRINTGGTPLNKQEIRHCMSKTRSRDFLKRCTHSEEFDRATGGCFTDHIRMDDREVVLRFCAFRLGGVEGYAEHGSMDPFLEDVTMRLDDPAAVSDTILEELYEAFMRAMRNCYEVFGDHAFRKWPRGSDRKNPINRSLFDCWSHELADIPTDHLLHNKNKIVDTARRLMTENRDYVDAITSSTGDVQKVRLRFRCTAAAAEAGAGTDTDQ
jgi:hypothetical protein